MIHELVNKNVTVVTNSIHHAAQLVEKQIPTVMVGGSVKMATDASIGGVALNQINQLHFDRAFIGMNGVDVAIIRLLIWRRELLSVLF